MSPLIEKKLIKDMKRQSERRNTMDYKTQKKYLK